jgi:hypothetical protein
MKLTMIRSILVTPTLSCCTDKSHRYPVLITTWDSTVDMDSNDHQGQEPRNPIKILFNSKRSQGQLCYDQTRFSSLMASWQRTCLFYKSLSTLYGEKVKKYHSLLRNTMLFFPHDRRLREAYRKENASTRRELK